MVYRLEVVGVVVALVSRVFEFGVVGLLFESASYSTNTQVVQLLCKARAGGNQLRWMVLPGWVVLPGFF